MNSVSGSRASQRHISGWRLHKYVYSVACRGGSGQPILAVGDIPSAESNVHVLASKYPNDFGKGYECLL